MLRFIRYILLLPIFLLVVALAVANRTPVSFSLNPFDPDHPSLTINEIPLFVLLFGTLFAGILLGGLCSWLKQGKWRHRARANQKEITRLQKEPNASENPGNKGSNLFLSHTPTQR